MRAGANVKAANRYGIPPITLAATNGSAKALDALLEAGADPNTQTPAGEPVLMTAARTGNADAVQAARRPRRRRQRARAVVRRDRAHVGGGREPRRRGRALAGAGRRDQRQVHDARGAGAGVPAQRRPELAVPARRLDGADVRGSRRGDRGRARAGRARRRPQHGGAPADRHSAEARGARRRADQGIGTTALVFAIINSHYDLAAVLLEKGADPNVVDIAGMAALYAAVDMNSLQWVQGRPAPILTDRLDARGRGQEAARRRARIRTRG